MGHPATTIEPQAAALAPESVGLQNTGLQGASLNGGTRSTEPAAADMGVKAAAKTVAVVGLGYVGLPTGIALASAGLKVLGIDSSERRLENIEEGSADLLPIDRGRLEQALTDQPGERARLVLTSDAAAITEADAVVICVPTPVDERLRPDLRCLKGACETVVERAREGQLVVLTSTTYVGTTRDFLVSPFARRGLRTGEDVFVAFSPERIDPGNTTWRQEAVPRLVGGVTPACTRAAEALLTPIAGRVHRVSSPEAAELAKLYENSFRAVNIAFANEMAGVSRRLGLDPIEVIEAAATKPYGFMAFYPGGGVGGHCIPCDPYYLLGGLREVQATAPVLERAMAGIAARPREVVARAAELLEDRGKAVGCARVLVVGAAYKPEIQDTRESPALEILRELSSRGALVAYHDPLVRSLSLEGDLALLSVAQPDPADYDLAIVMTAHSGFDYAWLDEMDHVLDCTYRTAAPAVRALV
jgi:UDP-N-acetyl-D-glucosamine dehydrogenase